MTPATPKIALFIIDVQEEFLNGHTKHLPPLMARLQQQYSRVFVTRFVNPPDSPFRKLLDHRTPHPDNIEPRLTFLLAHHAKVRNKSTYSALDRRLITELHMSGVSELHLAGNDTDACVMATALHAFDQGLTPVVLADCCASSAGPTVHEAALKMLARNIGQAQVRSSTP